MKAADTSTNSLHADAALRVVHFSRRLSIWQLFWKWFIPIIRNVFVVLFAVFLFGTTVKELYMHNVPPFFTAVGVEILCFLLCLGVLSLPSALRGLEAWTAESVSGYSHRIEKRENAGRRSSASSKASPIPPLRRTSMLELKLPDRTGNTPVGTWSRDRSPRAGIIDGSPQSIDYSYPTAHGVPDGRAMARCSSGDLDTSMLWLGMNYYDTHRKRKIAKGGSSLSSSLLFEGVFFPRSPSASGRASIHQNGGHSLSQDNLLGRSPWRNRLGGQPAPECQVADARQLAFASTRNRSDQESETDGKKAGSRRRLGERRQWVTFVRNLLSTVWHQVIVPLAHSRACFFSLLLRTFAWCCVWLWATAYMIRPSGNTSLLTWNFSELPESYYFVESTFLWMVTLDYCVGLLVCSNKLKYVFSLMSIIDLATMPVTMFFIKLVVAVVMEGEERATATSMPWLLVLGYLRFLRLVKTEAILSHCFPALRAVTMRIIAIAITIITIVLTFAGCMFTLEGPVELYNYTNVYDFFYYAVVTVATVGYGDFSPSTTAGRTVAIIAIVVTLSYLPGEIQRLMETLRTPRTLIGSIPSSAEDYLCFIGPVQPPQLAVMCREMSHSFPGSVRRVVLITPLDVSLYRPVVQAAMSKGGIRICVKGGKRGNPYPSKLRQLLSHARAVFVFSDTRCYEGAHATWWEGIEINEQEEDQLTLLRFMGARSVCWPMRPISVQLIHDYRKGLVTEMGAYNIICLNEVKMKLMGKSCGDCPGFLTLVGNWFYRPTRDARASRTTDANVTDLHRYIHGAQYQVYRMDFPDCMRGMRFELMVRLFYRNFNVFLIGIVSISKEIWVNPFGYNIGEEVGYYTMWPFAGIVLAPSLDIVVKLSQAKDLSFQDVTDVPLKSLSSAMQEDRFRNSLSGLHIAQAPGSIGRRTQKAGGWADQFSLTPSGPSIQRRPSTIPSPSPVGPSVPLPSNLSQSPPSSPTIRSHSSGQASPHDPVVVAPPGKGVQCFEEPRHLLPPPLHNRARSLERQYVGGIEQVGSVSDAKRSVFVRAALELVLICGWPRGLRLFLKALLASGEYNSVILSPTYPANVGVNELATYSHCTCYIRGSALDTTDLLRAGALQARSCSVFSTSHVVWRGDLSAHKLDTQAILVKHTIHTLFNAFPQYIRSNHGSRCGTPGIQMPTQLEAGRGAEVVAPMFSPSATCNRTRINEGGMVGCVDGEDDVELMAQVQPLVLVELREAAYLEYLHSSLTSSVPETHGKQSEDSKLYWESRGGYSATPEFASGRVFIEEMFYGLMAYGLPVSRYAMDPTILDYLIEGPNPSPSLVSSPSSLRVECIASPTRGFKSLPSFSSPTPLDTSRRPDDQRRGKGLVVLVDIPLPFVDASFKRLFLHMFRYKKCITLGVYRLAETTSLTSDYPTHVVISCPDAEVRLRSTDKIYVLQQCADEDLFRFRGS